MRHDYIKFPLAEVMTQDNIFSILLNLTLNKSYYGLNIAYFPYINLDSVLGCTLVFCRSACLCKGTTLLRNVGKYSPGRHIPANVNIELIIVSHQKLSFVSCWNKFCRNMTQHEDAAVYSEEHIVYFSTAVSV